MSKTARAKRRIVAAGKRAASRRADVVALFDKLRALSQDVRLDAISNVETAGLDASISLWLLTDRRASR